MSDMGQVSVPVDGIRLATYEPPGWKAEVFPRTFLYIARRPHWWARLWHWVFFGLKWERV